MNKALVFYKKVYLSNYGEYVIHYCSKIMDCAMVTESTLKEWRKELEELEKCYVEILGFSKLD